MTGSHSTKVWEFVHSQVFPQALVTACITSIPKWHFIRYVEIWVLFDVRLSGVCGILFYTCVIFLLLLPILFCIYSDSAPSNNDPQGVVHGLRRMEEDTVNCSM